jgi:hypothetical protein
LLAYRELFEKEVGACHANKIFSKHLPSPQSETFPGARPRSATNWGAMEGDQVPDSIVEGAPLSSGVRNARP